MIISRIRIFIKELDITGIEVMIILHIRRIDAPHQVLSTIHRCPPSLGGLIITIEIIVIDILKFCMQISHRLTVFQSERDDAPVFKRMESVVFHS